MRGGLEVDGSRAEGEGMRESQAGKCALVTGGAVRVGRAISLALAGEGLRVIVHYNSSSEAADELVGSIREKGGEAVAIGADLSRHGEVERLAEEAEGAFGGVDVLVNNASVFPEERLADVSEELWDSTMAVNLKAPFFLTKLLGARMRDRGAGLIVNLVDLAGIQAWGGYAAHGISKAGLVHLTKVAARSLAPEVRVVGIAPGTVLPPEDFSDEQLRLLAKRTLLETIGSPDDVVHALLYLLHAPFVTGEIMIVDGGRVLR
jgi:pteridine reductase